jgi:hypothetical protein
VVGAENPQAVVEQFGEGDGGSGAALDFAAPIGKV